MVSRPLVHSTTYACDTAFGAMTNISYSDGTPSVSFTYDRLGRQTAITDATGTRTFAYNDAFQLAAETNAFGVLVRSYDGLGRSAGFSLFNPANPVNPVQCISYGYDSLGRFQSATSAQSADTNTWSYAYLPNSDLISGWSNGILQTVRNYEPNRDLITAVDNRAGTDLISRFDYTNDQLARRTQRIDHSGAGVPPAITNTFGYNPRSELTSAAMGTNQYGYAYDPIGNRTSATNNAEVLTYLANDLNQYTTITNGGIRTLAYDLDGNLTNDSVFAYTWDAENRLVSAEQVGTAVPAVRFAYDYMSRRVEKAVNGVTNRFVYDGWDLISETTSTGITNVYVWGVDLSGSIQGAGGVGGLMAVVRNGQTYYPVVDGNGNITDYVDANGTVVANREFDAYGNTTIAIGPMVHTFNVWFSSKCFDQETGLYYYGYRYLSTALGRWLNRDPIGENGGVCLYAGCRNNTINSIDPVGHYQLVPDNEKMRCGTAIGIIEKNYRFWDEFKTRAERMGEKGCNLLFDCSDKCDSDVGGKEVFTPPKTMTIILCTKCFRRKEWRDWYSTFRHEFSHAYDDCLGGSGFPCWSTDGSYLQEGRICTEIRAYRNGVTPAPTKEDTIEKACASVRSACGKGRADDVVEILCKSKAKEIYDACSNIDVLDPIPVLTPIAP
jgi:RHS repeat-associated protein